MKIALACVLGVASAMKLKQDPEVLQSMPQGSGMDHTLWTWQDMFDEQQQEVDDAAARIPATQAQIDGAQADLDEVHERIGNETAIAYKSCQLHRNEEINLFYQCMQDAINNYALDHYGGEVRSYDRWKSEAEHCYLKYAQYSDCPGETEHIQTPIWATDPTTLIQPATPILCVPGPYYTYEHFAPACVAGHNIVQYDSISVEDCQQLCNEYGEGCYGIEYGVAYGGGSGYLPAGGCKLASSNDISGCDGAVWNEDFYKKHTHYNTCE